MYGHIHCLFSTLRLNPVLNHGGSSDFRDGVHLFMPPNSPELIGSRNCVPMAFTTESPQDSSSNGCCFFRYLHGPINVRLSFSHTHYTNIYRGRNCNCSRSISSQIRQPEHEYEHSRSTISFILFSGRIPV